MVMMACFWSCLLACLITNEGTGERTELRAWHRDNRYISHLLFECEALHLKAWAIAVHETLHCNSNEWIVAVPCEGLWGLLGGKLNDIWGMSRMNEFFWVHWKNSTFPTYPQDRPHRKPFKQHPIRYIKPSTHSMIRRFTPVFLWTAIPVVAEY